MNCHVNGKKMLLNTDDCVIMNCGQMHFSSSDRFQECTFFCLIFHPQLFAGNAFVYQEFIRPVLENSAFEYRYFHSGHPFHNAIEAFIEKVNACKKEKSWGYEMRVIGFLHEFWIDFVHQNSLAAADSMRTDHSELKIQQEMLLFIHQHYMEKISLNDIAGAGNVCRSKCCNIFKQYLDDSPMNFLNQYRLQVSCKLLGKKELTITDIACRCGFVHNSYYGRVFRENYGISPKEYREMVYR